MIYWPASFKVASQPMVKAYHISIAIEATVKHTKTHGQSLDYAVSCLRMMLFIFPFVWNLANV